MNDIIESDIAELKEIAEWFRQRRDNENAQFLINLANRYEVVSGAYRTVARAIENIDGAPLDDYEIDEIAREQNTWDQEGYVRFDYRAFAREIEIRHGITKKKDSAA